MPGVGYALDGGLQTEPALRIRDSTGRSIAFLVLEDGPPTPRGGRRLLSYHVHLRS
jgi:hypothetical protein